MFTDAHFRDQVAIVTGGGTGLGLAMAEALASRGAQLVLASRNPEHLEAPVAAICAAGGRAEYRVVDIRQPDAVAAMVRDVAAKLGRLDILINNAAGNFVCPTEKLSPNGWRSVIDIVLNGTFYCSRFAGEVMIEQKSGRILNIIANYAWGGSPGTIHSAAAKAGVLALTRTLAVEWARFGIRVNAIAPGPIDTEGARQQLWDKPQIYERLVRSVPLRRFGKPEDVANAALYLLSEYANYVTGEVLVVDGGEWLQGSMPFFEGVSE